MTLDGTPRRRPQPGPAPGSAVARTDPAPRGPDHDRDHDPDRGPDRDTTRTIEAARGDAPARRSAGRAGRRPVPQPGAVVTVARVGRLLTRASWRIARQLPGVGASLGAVEAQAQRLGTLAATEFVRLLDTPQQLIRRPSPSAPRLVSPVLHPADDPSPLRTAMGELLQRSSAADSAQTRDYLFGSIVSQLVPDEARVLAALARGQRFAAVDVILKPNGRSGRSRIVLANVSTVGTAAGIAVPASAATYLGRLHGFGLIDFIPDPSYLDAQFETVLRDPAVSAARASIEGGRQGSAKIARKAVTLTALGEEFWRSCAPDRT